jgi:hypothetical protein
MAELKYLPDGIRLHIKELFYKLKKIDFNEYYFFHFDSIATGLKAEKLLKKENIFSIPVPDDIFKDCGVAILTGLLFSYLYISKLIFSFLSISFIFSFSLVKIATPQSLKISSGTGMEKIFSFFKSFSAFNPVAIESKWKK